MFLFVLLAVAVACNNSDVRYIVGLTDHGRVIPLYVKSLGHCYSNGVNIMKILHGKWVCIFLMMKHGWRDICLMERKIKTIRRFPRK